MPPLSRGGIFSDLCSSRFGRSTLIMHSKLVRRQASAASWWRGCSVWSYAPWRSTFEDPLHPFAWRRGVLAGSELRCFILRIYCIHTCAPRRTHTHTCGRSFLFLWERDSPASSARFKHPKPRVAQVGDIQASAMFTWIWLNFQRILFLKGHLTLKRGSSHFTLHFYWGACWESWRCHWERGWSWQDV